MSLPGPDKLPRLWPKQTKVAAAIEIPCGNDPIRTGWLHYQSSRSCEQMTLKECSQSMQSGFALHRLNRRVLALSKF